MTKREFNGTLKDILTNLKKLRDDLENCGVGQIKDDLESLQGDAEETVDNCKSEELQEAWSERADNMADFAERLSIVEEAHEAVDELINEIEGMLEQ